jgi:hypothetical protein
MRANSTGIGKVNFRASEDNAHAMARLRTVCANGL